MSNEQTGWSELLEKQQQIESKLKQFQENTRSIEEANTPVASRPRYDLYLSDGVLYLELELAGVRQEDLEVAITPGQIRISGAFQKLAKEHQFLVQARPRGNFEYLLPISGQWKLDAYDTRWFEGVFYLKAEVQNLDS